MQTKSRLPGIASFALLWSVALLPMKIQLSLYGIIVFCLLAFITWVNNTRFRINLGVILILLFLALFLSALFSSDGRTATTFLGREIFLLLIPLAFFLYKISDQEKHKALRFFVWGCVVSCVINLLVAIWNSLILTESGFVFDPRVLKEPQIDFATSIVWGGNYFFSADLSSFMHPSYFSMYLIFACCIVLVFGNRFHISGTIRACVVVFLLVMVYLLSSRAAFFSVFLLSLFLWVKRVSTWTRFKRVIVLGTIIVVSFAGFIFNPKLKDLFLKFRTEGLTLQSDGRYSYETRLLTWYSACQIISRHVAFGVGVGDLQNELQEIYLKNKFVVPYEEKYNVHNQFLETFAGGGIVTFLILVLVFLTPLYLVRYDHLVSCFLLLTSFNFLFETMLVRYHGVTFFSLFYCLLLGGVNGNRKDEN